MSHTADLILLLAHSENMWVIRLIGNTYLHNCTYRADVYILGHYRLIPISLHPYLLNIMHCCIFRKYKALETQQATNFSFNKESSNIIMYSNFGKKIFIKRFNASVWYIMNTFIMHYTLRLQVKEYHFYFIFYFLQFMPDQIFHSLK